MPMSMIGRWGNPLNPVKHGDLIEQAVKRFQCRCAFCGVQMPQTASNPYAGLFACVAQKGSATELANLVVLCPVCVRFNDLENLRHCGQFVELPWISQGKLINILRIIYCVQQSQDEYVRQSRLYQGSNAILESLSRTPVEWEQFEFDGSPEKVIEAEKAFFGLPENPKNKTRYIDRLRFFWSPEAFAEAIQFWRPTIEAQLIQYEYKDGADLLTAHSDDVHYSKIAEAEVDQ